MGAVEKEANLPLEDYQHVKEMFLDQQERKWVEQEKGAKEED